MRLISTCQVFSSFRRPLTLPLNGSLVAKVGRFRVSLNWLPLSALRTYAYGCHFDWFSSALGLRESKAVFTSSVKDGPKWREKYEGAKRSQLEDNGFLNTGLHFTFTRLAVPYVGLSPVDHAIKCGCDFTEKHLYVYKWFRHCCSCVVCLCLQWIWSVHFGKLFTLFLMHSSEKVAFNQSRWFTAWSWKYNLAT